MVLGGAGEGDVSCCSCRCDGPAVGGNKRREEERKEEKGEIRILRRDVEGCSGLAGAGSGVRMCRGLGLGLGLGLV